MEYCENIGIKDYCNLLRYENKNTIVEQVKEHSYFPLLKNNLDNLNQLDWET